MMKTFTPLLRRIHHILFISMIVVLLTSCSKKIRFATSTVVPAAEGVVKVDRDKNKNYSIEVSVSNLAAPDRLTPSRDAYVVWMETEDGPIRNIGQMKTSSGLFSNHLKGTLTTVSVRKPTRIYITAEKSAEVKEPDNYVVLTTRSF